MYWFGLSYNIYYPKIWLKRIVILISLAKYDLNKFYQIDLNLT